MLLFSLLFSLSAHACATPPAAVVNLDVNKFYADPKNSIVDPILKAKHDKAVQPLEKYTNAIADLADARDNACALTWLTAWAKGGALLGTMTNKQAFYERKWMLAGVGLTYARVRGETHSTKIEMWISKLANLTMEHSAVYKGNKNNHYFWEGLAVGVSGVLTGNEKQTEWARRSYDYAMEEIRDDGTLPLELARGQRALHYHVFAAAPLVFLDSVLNLHSPKLKLLVEFIFRGLQDSTAVAKLAGAAQEKEPDHDIAWLQVYLRRYPNPAMEKFLGPNRRLHYSKLGGNLRERNPLEHTN